MLVLKVSVLSETSELECVSQAKRARRADQFRAPPSAHSTTAVRLPIPSVALVARNEFRRSPLFSSGNNICSAFPAWLTRTI